MAKLRTAVKKIRTKNAGPFWLTIDIFCEKPGVYDAISSSIKTEHIAQLFQTPVENIKRFDISDLCVVKFSLPRPQTQGCRHDSDMHGSSYAALVGELEY